MYKTNNQKKNQVILILLNHIGVGLCVGNLLYIILSKIAYLKYKGLHVTALFGCIFALSFVDAFIFKETRVRNIIKTELIGGALYAMWQYRQYVVSWIYIFIVLVFIAVIVGHIFVYFRREKNNDKQFKIKLNLFLERMRNVMSWMALVTIVLIILLYNVFMYNLRTTIRVGEQKSIDLREIEAIQNEKSWENLPLLAKCTVIKNILINELNLIGLKRNIKIEFSCDMPPSVSGSYSTLDHIIFINLEQLYDMKADEALDVALHEIRHVMQVAAINNEYDINKTTEEVAVWKTNLQNLESVSQIVTIEDYSDYYSNPLEIDAFQYAQLRAEYYMRKK